LLAPSSAAYDAMKRDQRPHKPSTKGPSRIMEYVLPTLVTLALLYAAHRIA